jgi:predicted NUDIX family phosphoesterase
VGRVHLGVVHVYELEHPALTPREDGLAEAGFVPVPVVRNLRPEFETWSQICIDSLLGAR